MSSDAMVSFLRKMAPGVEQSLQQNETVDIFQARVQLQLTKAKVLWVSFFSSSTRTMVRPILKRCAPPLDGELRLMSIDIFVVLFGYVLP